MKKLQKLATIITLCAMASLSSQNVEAEEYCTGSGGCAYESGYESCCLAPAVALGVAALAIIIAVGIHKSKGNHAHSSSDTL